MPLSINWRLCPTLTGIPVQIREYQAADAVEILCGGAKQPSAKLDIALAEAKKKEGPTATVVDGDRVMACFGLSIVWEGMAEAWMLCVSDINKHPMVARNAKRCLKNWIEEYKLVRIQAPLRADFMDGIKLAHWLGFECEGRMRKYQPDGTDALMHSIIIEG